MTPKIDRCALNGRVTGGAPLEQGQDRRRDDAASPGSGLLHEEAGLGQLGESGDVLKLGRDDVEDLCARLLAGVRAVLRAGEQVTTCRRKDRLLEGCKCQQRCLDSLSCPGCVPVP